MEKSYHVDDVSIGPLTEIIVVNGVFQQVSIAVFRHLCCVKRTQEERLVYYKTNILCIIIIITRFNSKTIDGLLLHFYIQRIKPFIESGFDGSIFTRSNRKRNR